MLETLAGVDETTDAAILDRFYYTGLGRLGTFLSRVSLVGSRRYRFFKCNSDLRANRKCDIYIAIGSSYRPVYLYISTLS